LQNACQRRAEAAPALACGAARTGFYKEKICEKPLSGDAADRVWRLSSDNISTGRRRFADAGGLPRRGVRQIFRSDSRESMSSWLLTVLASFTCGTTGP
jgi:hypothetical protein